MSAQYTYALFIYPSELPQDGHSAPSVTLGYTIMGTSRTYSDEAVKSDVANIAGANTGMYALRNS